MTNPFTEEEIAFCTYVAMYGADDGIDAGDIETITGRNLASILLEIRNIVAMLDEKGVGRYSRLHPLSGATTEESGRRPHWDWVEPLTKLSKEDLLERCRGA